MPSSIITLIIGLAVGAVAGFIAGMIAFCKMVTFTVQKQRKA